MIPEEIQTEAENEAALKRIEQIFFAEPGTPEGEELERLITLVERFEKKAYPFDPPFQVKSPCVQTPAKRA
jgi:HTH-type transcriptional regulator/antitoxin HigA